MGRDSINTDVSTKIFEPSNEQTTNAEAAAPSPMKINRGQEEARVSRDLAPIPASQIAKAQERGIEALQQQRISSPSQERFLAVEAKESPNTRDLEVGRVAEFTFENPMPPITAKQGENHLQSQQIRAKVNQNIRHFPGEVRNTPSKRLKVNKPIGNVGQASSEFVANVREKLSQRMANFDISRDLNYQKESKVADVLSQLHSHRGGLATDDLSSLINTLHSLGEPILFHTVYDPKKNRHEMHTFETFSKMSAGERKHQEDQGYVSYFDRETHTFMAGANAPWTQSSNMTIVAARGADESIARLVEEIAQSTRPIAVVTVEAESFYEISSLISDYFEQRATFLLQIQQLQIQVSAPSVDKKTEEQAKEHSEFFKNLEKRSHKFEEVTKDKETTQEVPLDELLIRSKERSSEEKKVAQQATEEATFERNKEDKALNKMVDKERDIHTKEHQDDVVKYDRLKEEAKEEEIRRRL